MAYLPESALEIAAFAVPAVIAITMHEAAHGFVADRLGDDTARRLGRVTLNPLRHIDPVGTVLVPAILLLSGAGFLFGWAKPVPVNFRRLHQPRRDMVLVAAAGPGTNFALATVSAASFHLLWLFPDSTFLSSSNSDWIVVGLANSMMFNLMLGVFNLLPLPPLDGGRVAVGLLPNAIAIRLARLERFGILILLSVFFLLPLLAAEIGYDVDPFGILIGEPVDWMRRLITWLTGLSTGEQ